MAEKRMFAKTIVLSDAFLDMPMSARCLYFTLSMVADDDGFVNAPKSIMRQCGASTDDMNILLMKKFILAFDTGVIVIKHWRVNNYLRSDRHIDTKYKEELSVLSVDKDGVYSLESGIPSDNQVTTIGIPSIDKNRLDKDSIDKDRVTVSKDTVCWTQDVQRVIEAWNNTSFPFVSKIALSSKRGQMLRARLTEHGIDAVIDTINRANDSAFLKGQNNKNWICTFDWFVKPSNFVKVMEGNYDARSAATQQFNSRPTFSDLLEELKKEEAKEVFVDEL